MEHEAIMIARIKKKIERKQIAASLGISTVAYGKIESGKTNAKKYIHRLREFLNPELDEELKKNITPEVKVQGYIEMFKIVLPSVTETQLYNQTLKELTNNEVVEDIISLSDLIATKVTKHLNQLTIKK